MPRILLCMFVLASFAGPAAMAQTSSTANQSGAGQTAANSTSAGNYSGMYTFLRDGEFVQITQEDKGKLSGFISRYGELESDRGAFLDQFFKHGSLDGHNLRFTTDEVHGVWFEFQGTADRGPGKTVNDEGYYVLKGTLTQYSTDANHKQAAKSRDVVFKSFPQDVSAPAGTPKD
ncbi:MAG TPA: hypothetical protein VKR26_09335 [Terriglobales bacterium]|nr:hypothetical protein [Terriglobales bacterium]